MEIYDCGIDGVMPNIHIKLIDNRLIADKIIYTGNHEGFGFAVVARQQYGQNLKFTQFGKLLKYDNNKANCYIQKTKSYPRSNPKEIGLIYQIYPLREINEGQQLFVIPYTFVELGKNGENNLFAFKTASSPLREQPDYKCQTTQDKMKQIAKQLYQQSNVVSEIVEDLYNMQVKNASKYF